MNDPALSDLKIPSVRGLIADGNQKYMRVAVGTLTWIAAVSQVDALITQNIAVSINNYLGIYRWLTWK